MLLLWSMVTVVQLVVLLWQVPQSMDAPFKSWASGMWLVGLASAPVEPWLVKLPLWQVLQAVAVTTEWSMRKPVLTLVEPWQAMQ